MKLLAILITNNITARGGAKTLCQVALFIFLPDNIQKSGLTYTNGKLTSVNGETFSYDLMGNPTTYKGNEFVWEQGRKLTSGSMNGKEAEA